jgi:plasmid stabilization system protein ParE
MSFEIKFTPEAEETYDAITEQLRERWGDSFVMKLEVKVLKCLNDVLITPQMYPVIEEKNEIRKCVLHKNCSMLYRIFDDSILVICFWDNRQDPLIS